MTFDWAGGSGAAGQGAGADSAADGGSTLQITGRVPQPRTLPAAGYTGGAAKPSRGSTGRHWLMDKRGMGRATETVIHRRLTDGSACPTMPPRLMRLGLVKLPDWTCRSAGLAPRSPWAMGILDVLPVSPAPEREDTERP